MLFSPRVGPCPGNWAEALQAGQGVQKSSILLHLVRQQLGLLCLVGQEMGLAHLVWGFFDRPEQAAITVSLMLSPGRMQRGQHHLVTQTSRIFLFVF